MEVSAVTDQENVESLRAQLHQLALELLARPQESVRLLNKMYWTTVDVPEDASEGALNLQDWAVEALQIADGLERHARGPNRQILEAIAHDFAAAFLNNGVKPEWADDGRVVVRKGGIADTRST